MLLLYLMIVNLVIIRSRFDIVVMTLLLLYHFSNYILIIKIDNLFIIFPCWIFFSHLSLSFL